MNWTCFFPFLSKKPRSRNLFWNEIITRRDTNDVLCIWFCHREKNFLLAMTRAVGSILLLVYSMAPGLARLANFISQWFGHLSSFVAVVEGTGVLQIVYFFKVKWALLKAAARCCRINASEKRVCMYSTAWCNRAGHLATILTLQTSSKLSLWYHDLSLHINMKKMSIFSNQERFLCDSCFTSVGTTKGQSCCA